MMKENELLDIFERFGDNAQKAIDFVRANRGEQDGEAAAALSDYRCTGNGVHIVYPDGSSWLFGKSLPKTPGMRVGICHDGHRWLIGTDYGDMAWTEDDESELENDKSGICEDWETMFHWEHEAWRYRESLGKFWSHIPFKDDETMPTGAMVLAQEYYARYDLLNDALEFCGLPEYNTNVDRWFAERYTVGSARFFYSNSGILYSYLVHTTNRVQAVALWK